MRGGAGRLVVGGAGTEMRLTLTSHIPHDVNGGDTSHKDFFCSKLSFHP